MKKIISIVLIMIMSVTMLTGCGGPDLTVVKEKYNKAADVFNEAAKLVDANGWKDDEESLKLHNELADAIEEIKVTIEDSKQAKEIDVDTMSKELDSLISALNEYKEAVSVPYGGPDLTVVNEKYNQAADVFNEAAKLVDANGWKDDEESLKLHNDLAHAIEEIKVIIEDPKQAKEIDVDTMSKNLDGLISALNEYKKAVSTPYGK